MPSSLPSSNTPDIPGTIDTSLPDEAFALRNTLMPENGLQSSIHFEEDATTADAAAAATDADNVSFLRALPISDENDNNIDSGVGSNGYPLNVTNTAFRRQTTNRSVAGNTGHNYSPRLQRLHSRAREIRVEDRALRDRLQRIIHRLNQARDHGNSDRNTSFSDDFESNWSVIAQDRMRNSDFDSHAYGHPSRRNQRESATQTNANSRDDIELERLAHAFSLSYASWIGQHAEESTRHDPAARGLYRREGSSGISTEQEQQTEQLQHVEPSPRNRQDEERYTGTQHGSHRDRRLPSSIQEYLTDTPRPGRLALPAPVPTSATSTHLSLAQSNAALLQSARQYTESPNSSSLTRRPTDNDNMYPQRSGEQIVRTTSGFGRPIGSLPSIANLDNNIETWSAPTQERNRHMMRLLQQYERRSNEARREMGRREWQEYQLRNQMAYESANNTPTLPRASNVSERSERANHMSELVQTMENVFPGRRRQHSQERYLDLLQHDTQYRIDAYRRRYLENPGNSSVGYNHPTPRQSTPAVSTNSFSNDVNNNRSFGDREVVDTRINSFAMSNPPILPGLSSSMPSPLSSYITARPEQALRYLARLRSSTGFEESLAHAIVAGFATSEFFVEKHDDFAMEAESLPHPYETSWLAPGQVFCGFQKAIVVNQKNGNRCRRHESGSGGRRSNNSGRDVGRNSAISSRSYRFSNVRPMTSTTFEPPSVATRARSFVTEVGPSTPRSHNDERPDTESGQQRQQRQDHQRLQELREIRHELQRVLERIQRARQRADQLQEQQRQQQAEHIMQELQQQEQRQRDVERQLQMLQERGQQMGEKDEEQEEHQQQQQNRWPVKVMIHSIDCNSMTMTATMEARNVPSYPSPAWSSVLHDSSRPVQRNSNMLATNPSTSASNSVISQNIPSSTQSGISTSATSGVHNNSSSIPNSSSELMPTYSITTYLEGEIIDFHKHSLLTETYASSPEIDAMYWRRLEPFRDLTDEQLVRKIVSRSSLKDIQQRYVLMRWKEQCFVRKLRSRINDHRKMAAGRLNSKANHEGQCDRLCESDANGHLDHLNCNFAVNGNDQDDDDENSDTFEDVDPAEPDSACGLTISGFYYVCLRRSDGVLEGLYYDPQSSPYQRLYLQPGFGDGGGSKRASQLRRKIRSWGQAGKTGKSKGVTKDDGNSSEVVKAGLRPVGVGDDDDDDDELEEDGELAWRNGNGIAGTGKGAFGVFPNWVFR